MLKKSSVDLQTHQKLSASDFTMIISEHGQYVKRFIAKKVCDPQEVEDIYQTTLMEAYKCHTKFRGESHPRTWLCGIAYNIFKNFLTNKKHWMHESLANIEAHDEISDTFDFKMLGLEDPKDIYERQELLDRIHEAFEDLPVNMRETFDAVVSDGASYEEASDTFGIPLGTVRSRVSRARESLRKDCLFD